MFTNTPRKQHAQDECRTTAYKPTHRLSLNQRGPDQHPVSDGKRSNSHQANRTYYTNKMKVLKLQEMPEHSVQKSVIKWRCNSPSKSSRCLKTKQNKSYQLKIKGIPSNTIINKVTRIILIDWLVEVSLQLGISKQALYQAVYYLDRLALLGEISKAEYQFYGVACLWLSHKSDCRKPISYAIAQSIVQGCRNERWFKQTEMRILKKLQYRLNPFTLWQQVNMLVCGFEKYFKKQLVQIADWPNYRNRIRWICEGLIMQNKHSEREQELLALSIVFLVGCKLAEDNHIQYKKLLTFYLKLLDVNGLQSLQKSAERIRHWMEYSCPCVVPFSPQVHHPELKRLVKQK